MKRLLHLISVNEAATGVSGEARPRDEIYALPTTSCAFAFEQAQIWSKKFWPPSPLPARSRSNTAVSEASRREVREGLEPSLARLWRYALVLSRARDVADDLVQATCPRAIERADQYTPGTRVDRWLLAILRSIWLNEIRSRRIREGGGFVDPEDALTTDGAREIEINITAVLRAIDRLPEAQRETVLLVYGEGYTYAEAAEALAIPIGTVMSRLAAARASLSNLK